MPPTDEHLFDAVTDQPPIERVWLGRDRPLMPGAADWLMSRAPDRDLPIADFTGTLVVCPTARAGRILLGELVDRAQSKPRACLPPMVITPGELAEALLIAPTPARPAGEVTRLLAWARALRSTPAVSQTLLSHPPDEADLDGWLRHARVLARVSDELGRAGLRFGAVPGRLGVIDGFPDAERWGAAASAQSEYERLLRERSLVDPVLGCLDTADEAPDGGDIGPVWAHLVLVGSVRLSPVARRACRRVGSITACVHAPAGMADAFGDDGAPRALVWADPERSPLRVDRERIVWTRTAADACEQALVALGRADPGEGDTRTIEPAASVLVCPDPTLCDDLGVLEALHPGLEFRDAGGTPLDTTPPTRALRALVGVGDDSLSGFRAALRNPLIEAWLSSGAGEAPVDLDRARMLIDEVSESSPTERVSDLRRALDRIGARGSPSGAVVGRLETLGAVFRREAPAPDGVETIRNLLDGLERGHQTGEPTGPDHQVTIAHAFEALRRCLDEVAEAAEAGATPGDARSLADLVLALSTRRRLPPPVRTGAVDLIGWGEMTGDPRARVVLLGVAEGALGAPPAEFALLTDSARTRLGISDDRTRLGDDACALWSAMGGRERLTVVVPREGADAQPLTPSRLLFFGVDADPETLSERVLDAIEPAARAPVRVVRDRAHSESDDADSGDAGLDITGLAPISDAYSPSAFRSYLGSPARFYLERVLRLASPAPRRPELDARAYGTVLHDTLATFGLEPDAHATGHARIRDALLDAFDRVRSFNFGDRPSASVRVQMELARHRIERVAEWHARDRDAGWRIERIEWMPESETGGHEHDVRGIPLEVDGIRAVLRGRLDRVDRHEATGARRVIDYKTGDKTSDPEKAHRTRRGWSDLQLPLYRWMLEHCDDAPAPEDPGGTGPASPEPPSDAPPSVGYVSIPRDTERVSYRAFEMSPEVYDEAMAVARSVIRSIRAERFQVPAPGGSSAVPGAAPARPVQLKDTDPFGQHVLAWLTETMPAARDLGEEDRE